MTTKPMTQDEKEDALAAILQEEIWKEITAESGYTRSDLDNELLAKIRAIKADLDTRTG